MDEIGQMLARLVGDEPLLYTLTGNTLANFESDEDALRIITHVLRPQDRLLLEVATTTRLDQEAADAAADEYHQTRAFAEFVTSALRYNTDLRIDNEQIKFNGEVEDRRRAPGQDRLAEQHRVPITMGLPDHTDVVLDKEDTILLYTTRKFSTERLRSSPPPAT